MPQEDMPSSATAPPTRDALRPTGVAVGTDGVQTRPPSDGSERQRPDRWTVPVDGRGLDRWPALEDSHSLARPFLARRRRICMLSVHTCPLAAPGGKETGGMNVYVRELSRELGRRGYTIDAFTRSQSSAVPHVPDTDLGDNVRVIHITSGPEAPVSKAEAYAHLPDFVRGVRAFAASQGITYDLYHAHYWMSGWVAQRLQRQRPAPLVQMFHTLGAMKDLAKGPGWKPEIEPRRQVERELMHHADAVVAATPADRAEMVRLYGADSANIQVIPPGVDLDRFRPIPPNEARARLGQDPDHRMILFVGRLDPVKGLDTLVRAMALVVERDPRWRHNSCLCVIGGDRLDDPREAEGEIARMDALRAELGIEDVVTFLGPQSQDDLPYYYSAAQVVVVPSRYESFGLVALEAMACGTPVIASNVGGLASLVRDGGTGYLVPDGDPEALAERLLPLLNDPTLRETLGSQGVATAEAYSWSAVAERIDALYREVLHTDLGRARL